MNEFDSEESEDDVESETHQSEMSKDKTSCASSILVIKPIKQTLMHEIRSRVDEIAEAESESESVESKRESNFDLLNQELDVE